MGKVTGVVKRDPINQPGGEDPGESSHRPLRADCHDPRAGHEPDGVDASRPEAVAGRKRDGSSPPGLTWPPCPIENGRTPPTLSRQSRPAAASTNDRPLRVPITSSGLWTCANAVQCATLDALGAVTVPVAIAPQPLSAIAAVTQTAGLTGDTKTGLDMAAGRRCESHTQLRRGRRRHPWPGSRPPLARTPRLRSRSQRIRPRRYRAPKRWADAPASRHQRETSPRPCPRVSEHVESPCRIARTDEERARTRCSAQLRSVRSFATSTTYSRVARRDGVPLLGATNTSPRGRPIQGLCDVLASARNARRNRGHRRAQVAGGLLIGQTLDLEGYQGLSVVVRRRRDRGDHFARIERERLFVLAAGISLLHQRHRGRSACSVGGRRAASRERLGCMLRNARRRQPTSFSFRSIRGRVRTLANVSWTRSSASCGEPHSARATR